MAQKYVNDKYVLLDDIRFYLHKRSCYIDQLQKLCEIEFQCHKQQVPRVQSQHAHSSEIRGLRSTKCSSETLQNLLYFMYKKTHVVFFVFHFVQL